MDEKGDFGNPRAEWVLHQFAKMSAPEDSITQSHRQDKIMEDIHKKLSLYKSLLKENAPLDDAEEKEFIDLQTRWEKEQNKEGTYLHHPKSVKTTSNTSVLFHKLWEDLVQLKHELNKLK